MNARPLGWFVNDWKLVKRLLVVKIQMEIARNLSWELGQSRKNLQKRPKLEDFYHNIYEKRDAKKSAKLRA